jgi:hypothetical protein
MLVVGLPQWSKTHLLLYQTGHEQTWAFPEVFLHWALPWGPSDTNVERCLNLGKLDDGLAKSLSVKVVDKTKKQQFLAKIGAYLNPVGLSLRPIRRKIGFVAWTTSNAPNSHTPCCLPGTLQTTGVPAAQAVYTVTYSSMLKHYTIVL